MAVYEPLGALLWVNIVNIQKESEMANQISTQTISFNHQSLVTFKQNGTHYTAMKPICENIGLDWKSQYSRMKRDDVLNSTMVIITIVAKDGKNREMLCIPIKKLNGWLFGLNPNKVRADLKERLENYQEECFLALWDYWTEGIARRDEVKNKMALWEQKKAEYTQRATERGKLLQQCKSEKRALEHELLQIKQLDLFVNL